MNVQEGEGWRLAVDRERQPFPVLLGGQGWASEFTWQEAALIGQGLQRLLEQQQALTDQLMAEEHLSLEWEAGSLWLGMEAGAGACSLRFILTAPENRRSLEGGWQGPACRAVAAGLAALELAPETLDPPR